MEDSIQAKGYRMRPNKLIGPGPVALKRSLYPNSVRTIRNTGENIENDEGTRNEEKQRDKEKLRKVKNEIKSKKGGQDREEKGKNRRNFPALR